MQLESAIQQKKFKNEYQKLLINIMYTNSWINGLHHQLFKPYGVSNQQYNILRILRGQYPQPITVNSLIGRMIDKMSNVSRLVEKLRLKGFIERTACPSDRRKVDIVITEEGLRFLNETDHVVSEMEVCLQDLTNEEAKELNRLLDKLRTSEA